MKSRVEANKKQHAAFKAINWLCSILCAALIVLLFFTVWFSAVRISDGGMAPVFKEGDVVLFDKLAKHISTPGRGEAVAFRIGEGTSVGRVVALPGDRVEVFQGKVYVNGYLLDESRYLEGECSWVMEEVTLKDGCFFVMPDDRTAQSPDFASMVIPFDHIIGCASVRVAPLGRIGLFRA